MKWNFLLPEQNEFGRIASQAAKQVILQKSREIERDWFKKNIREKKGEIVSGSGSKEWSAAMFDVRISDGRPASLFYKRRHSVENIIVSEKDCVFIFWRSRIETKSAGLDSFVLTRNSWKNFFELGVPEIPRRFSESKSDCPRAGNRTKIAAASKTEGIDRSALVGQARHPRYNMAVINELGNEKIDIIEWSENPGKIRQFPLFSPAGKIGGNLPRREAMVFVASKISWGLAIGKGGQNVRLAARAFIGWKIDVRFALPDEVQAEGIAAWPPLRKRNFQKREVAAEEKFPKQQRKWNNVLNLKIGEKISGDDQRRRKIPDGSQNKYEFDEKNRRF